uniref:Uncharacterized protein n=1 Tax=Candidatus Kentrum sp. DK TaxID=2126562 RepID=A0A450S560_9GAMM|nr:MAG: hypothetical protein BECKDK2373B_GA0170837_101518 [Candidatus Kentron sp. DK]
MISLREIIHRTCATVLVTYLGNGNSINRSWEKIIFAGFINNPDLPMTKRFRYYETVGAFSLFRGVGTRYMTVLRSEIITTHDWS